MSLHRFDAKRDANEPAIVEALESVGLIVRRVSSPSLPDLAVYSPQERFWRLIEVKGPTGKLNWNHVQSAECLWLSRSRDVRRM